MFWQMADMSHLNPRGRRKKMLSQSSSTPVRKVVVLEVAEPIRTPAHPPAILATGKTTVQISPSATSPAPSLTSTPLQVSMSTAAPDLAPNASPPKVYGKYFKPVKYTTAVGRKEMIGSRAYYRSWAFRKKKYAQKTKEAAELGPLLSPGNGRKTRRKHEGGERMRKVDERWRRHVRRL